MGDKVLPGPSLDAGGRWERLTFKGPSNKDSTSREAICWDAGMASLRGESLGTGAVCSKVPPQLQEVLIVPVLQRMKLPQFQNQPVES